jgi:hypothetical protein
MALRPWTALACAALLVWSAPARAATVDYVDYGGTPHALTPWEGKHLVFLTQRTDLDPSVMQRVLAVYDAGYELYMAATGREPAPNPLRQVHHKNTVAEVDKTCGAGCGQVGSSGIELSHDAFKYLYAAAGRGHVDHLVLYELGRNFWFFQSKLEFNAYVSKKPGGRGSGDAMLHGYPILMSTVFLQELKATAEINGASFDALREEQVAWFAKYAADPRQTFWTLFSDYDASLVTLPSGNRIGTMNFFSMMVFHLAQQHGGTGFVLRFWQAMGRMPDIASAQDALDNFYVAASEAAGQDLRADFARVLKVPVSAGGLARYGAAPAARGVVLDYAQGRFTRRADGKGFRWRETKRDGPAAFEFVEARRDARWFILESVDRPGFQVRLPVAGGPSDSSRDSGATWHAFVETTLVP